jgi:RNA polymerase sigma factor (sigma-70 family)
MPRTRLKTRPLPDRVARAKQVVKKGSKTLRIKKTERIPSSRTGEDLSSYFARISQSERRLTPEEELSLGEILQKAIRSTVIKLSARLESDLDLLAKTSTVSTTPDRVLEARQRTRRLNPDRLRGEKLKEHIKDVFYSEAGLDLLKTYDPQIGGPTVERMIRANLLLVASIAHKYYRHGGGMALSDLIQEGNIGLIIGALRFDYKRGYRFSTYASWWIRHANSRAIEDTAREIRIAVHTHALLQTAAKIRERLTEKLGRAPTIEEVADMLLAEKQKEALPPDDEAEKRARLISKLDRMSVLTQAPVSLHMIVGSSDSGDMELGDLVPAEGPEGLKPWSGLEGELLHREMQNLSPVELDILNQRFGLGANEERRTFREIGDAHGLSRERIRQIQNQALDKLRKALGRHIVT